MFDGYHIDAIGFFEVLVFVDEEQVALFEGDGLLVATQVLIINPTNIFINIFINIFFNIFINIFTTIFVIIFLNIVTIKAIIDYHDLQGSSSGYSLAAGHSTIYHQTPKKQKLFIATL